MEKAINKAPRSLYTVNSVLSERGFFIGKFGGHGVVGNTLACGTGIRGSFPLAHPYGERKLY